MYCRQLRVNNKALFHIKGPLLIACNHPDSFLDAIILSSLLKRPIYSLARGDAFKNKLYGILLRSLKMFPVYRTSEGVENMEHNYTTFDACKEIFKKNGIVLIFSEGRCINEWHLRPLKKGTARLALSSWEDGIDLKVLPTGINYQHFSIFGKNIHLNFGNIISQNDIDSSNGFGKSVISFNQKLLSELEPLVYEIDKNNQTKKEQIFAVPISKIKKIVLSIPAIVGYFIHWPLYYPAKKLALKHGSHTDHYDSILVGILFLSYPLYLFLTSLLTYCLLGGFYWLSVFIILPFCGWSYMQLKKQF
jgi:1-acyl-sn-glycerol-3-phosphate acyltransferase